MTTWFERVPKIELHLHLEGAIPHNVLWKLVKKYGGDASIGSLEALKEKFVFRDFPNFLETWKWKTGFIREYDDFTLIAEAVAHDLAAQNVRYAEVFCTPSDFRDKKLDAGRIVEAIRHGYNKIHDITINIVVDFCREYGPDNAESNLAAMNEVKNLGVIGFSIGGAEQTYPPGPFAGIYEKARMLGFHTSAHAGEAAGPESVWSAIRDLKVERIGHGTRINEDPALIDYIRQKAIPLEMCPVSNVRTRVVDSIEKHPVKQYYDKGLMITINTDDPKMFGNSLAGEYQLLCEKLDFTKLDIQNLIRNAVWSSWLPPPRKRDLERQILNDPGWQIK